MAADAFVEIDARIEGHVLDRRESAIRTGEDGLEHGRRVRHVAPGALREPVIRLAAPGAPLP